MARQQDIPPPDDPPAVRVVEQVRCSRCFRWLSSDASKARMMGAHCAKAAT